MNNDNQFHIPESTLANLINNFDWSETDLPPLAEWPENLRVSVQLCLSSRTPIVIFWGPKLNMLYNDPYISFLGDNKHPSFFAKPCQECWAEIWTTIGPMFEQVFKTRKATLSEDIQLFFSRKLPKEEVFVRFTYAPTLGTDGTVQGIFCPCTETTEQVLARRRLETLRLLNIRSTEAQTVEFACEKSLKVLNENSKDIPYAAVYLLDENNKKVTLCASTDGSNVGNIQKEILVSANGKKKETWPIASVLKNRKPEVIDNLHGRGIQLPPDTWSDEINQAIILPLPGASNKYSSHGILIIGISSRLVLDESYLSFFHLISVQIGALISDAKIYEEERIRTEKLAELNKAKTRFFSNISHEFRTPLTLILGLLDDASSSESILKGENFDVVHRNAIRLLRLVNTLLDFARIEEGRAKPAFEATDISLFTRDLVSNFRSIIEAAGLKLKVKCDSIPDVVHVDRSMWEKIVLNLLSNAYKYTFAGEIEVKLKRKPRRADIVQLSVRDTGTGIPKNELNNIFQRFHRIEGAKGRTYEGSGIGLAFIKELVAVHGGKINVKSKYGKGSTFTVEIPIGYNHLPQNQIINHEINAVKYQCKDWYLTEALQWSLPSSKNEIKKVSPGKGNRILIADDNADMREYLSRILSEYWTVHTVNDGEAALNAILKYKDSPDEKYDILLTDVMMPRMDGFQLLKALRSDSSVKNIRVMIISARAGEEAKIEGIKEGADDYLVKPFSANELIARVKTQFELSRQKNTILFELNAMKQFQTIATRFVQDSDVSSILLEIVDAAISITNASKCSIQLFNEKQDKLEFLAGRGFDQNFKNPFTIITPDKSSSGAALITKQRVIVENIRESPLFKNTDIFNHLNADGINTVQSTLLISRSGKLIGILSTYYTGMSLPEPKGLQLQMIDLLARLSADIIENGQWIKERGHLIEKLREVDKRKDDFLAVLSHELRNPLTSIINSIFILSRASQKSHQAMQAQATIKRQVNQMVHLVDDLLEVSSIAHNKIRLQKKMVDINELIARTVEDYRATFENANITLEINLLRKPLFMTIDPSRISQVIGNLLQNALKFSKDQGIVTLSITYENEEHVLMKVADNGIGIEPKQLDFLFKPFAQCSKDKNKGGLGLGLALVDGFVKMHGGEVSVTSGGIDQGAEFTVKLPIIKREYQEMKSPSADTTQSVSRVILVIDDNKDLAQSLQMLLEMFGHEVHIASNGTSAITRAKKLKPDIVLCDIGLPTMDGYQIAQHFKADKHLKLTHLIAISGYAQKEDIEKAYASGFAVHLTKPLDIERLTKILIDF